MIKLVTLLAAQGVVRDFQENTISAFNIFDGLEASLFPLFVQKMALLLILQREHADPSTQSLKIQVLINEQELISTDVEPDFQNKYRNHTVLKIEGIMIPAPGILKFRVFKDSEKLGEYEIEIKQTGQASIVLEKPKS